MAFDQRADKGSGRWETVVSYGLTRESSAQSIHY